MEQPFRKGISRYLRLAHHDLQLLQQLRALSVPREADPLFIHNIRNYKPLPVYDKGENVRAIDRVYHQGRNGETYNIGGLNEWKNIDLIKVLIATVDRLLGRAPGTSEKLITYVTDRAGHDPHYAVDAAKIVR